MSSKQSHRPVDHSEGLVLLISVDPLPELTGTLVAGSYGGGVWLFIIIWAVLMTFWLTSLKDEEIKSVCLG